MAPKFKFADGEKVLCFHGPLLYEAKCIKAQVKEKIVKYYIHYSGWNKNWDEWVPESRVLKFNDANMQKQKELAAAHGTGKKAKPAKANSKKDSSDRESSVLPPQDKTPKQKTKEAAPPLPTSVPETPTDPQRKKRRTVEQNVETEEEYSQKMEIKIKIPDELKRWVVDDWDLVTRQSKLFKLPARVTVETILSEYMKHRFSVKGMTVNKKSAILETINGIREYFNVMLGKQLLFKCERAQYLEIMSQNPDLTPSHLYGGFHLLRLFSKIGGALAYTQLDEDSIQLLTTNLFEFLKYVSKCASRILSVSDFVAAQDLKKNS
ncbi:mortality factor 4-like protein 1 [Parasteatoda tepidariorum]|uniref:mortality factor 4-like protein 1 n=1 Tax=Parasteatoda tepidariorum TaxID=114398 RepID=UPI001C7258B1|nr:mortality factor 4-like protein 1 [Parasteatoda tepidariorum]